MVCQGEAEQFMKLPVVPKIRVWPPGVGHRRNLRGHEVCFSGLCVLLCDIMGLKLFFK